MQGPRAHAFGRSFVCQQRQAEGRRRQGLKDVRDVNTMSAAMEDPSLIAKGNSLCGFMFMCVQDERAHVCAQGCKS